MGKQVLKCLKLLGFWNLPPYGVTDSGSNWPLPNYDKLVEAFEPLETASKTIKMFDIPYKVE